MTSPRWFTNSKRLSERSPFIRCSGFPGRRPGLFLDLDRAPEDVALELEVPDLAPQLCDLPHELLRSLRHGFVLGHGGTLLAERAMMEAALVGGEARNTTLPPVWDGTIAASRDDAEAPRSRRAFRACQ